MRIIPKKIKVKNTVWKCYSMADVIVALIVFAIIFIAITSGAFAFAVIMGLLAVVMFMPTQDGIFYSCILENIKFLFAKKVYTENADKQKERVDALLNLKDIKENGLIEYSGGYFGRVIKVGQKNFGIEDVVQQNIDIDYLANALKMLDGTQCADIIKIDRPVNLDNFAQDLFGRLAEMKENVDEEEVREIKTAILRERIDRIDKMNNIRKQYLSDYYIVVYGRNELDLENTTINVASEINKCGLNISVIRIPIHKRHKFCKKQFACDRLCLPFTVRRIAPHKRISCAFFARAQGKNFLFLVYQNLSVRRIRKFRETCGVDV